MKSKPNILLITVDALRARNLSCYGYHKNTSPNIDRLARRGIVFNKCFSCFNATDPSFTSILTGKYPISHGILHHGNVPQNEIREYYSRGNKSLSEILKSNGYITLALSWLERWHKEGFDYYAYYGGVWTTHIKRLVKNTLNKLPDRFQKHITRAIVARIPGTKILDAQSLTNHAIKVIKANLDKKKPFFFLIHYMDVHLPYNPPKDFEKAFFEETPDNKKINDILKKIKNPEWKKFLKQSLGNAKTTDENIAKYNGAISYIDKNIGDLVEFLEKTGIEDNTIIIITSDHGESLTEHDIYFSHHGLYDETIHVPLIFYYPSCPKGKRVPSFVQHVDIVPTILDILNIKNNFCFDGETLIPLIKGEVKWIRPTVFAEESSTQRKRAIRTNNFKYICTVSDDRVVCDFDHNGVPQEKGVCRYCGFVHGGIEELYDLKKDPEEVQNIINEKVEIAKAFKENLFDLIENLEYKREKNEIKQKIYKLKEGKKI